MKKIKTQRTMLLQVNYSTSSHFFSNIQSFPSPRRKLSVAAPRDPAGHPGEDTDAWRNWKSDFSLGATSRTASSYSTTERFVSAFFCHPMKVHFTFLNPNFTLAVYQFMYASKIKILFLFLSRCPSKVVKDDCIVDEYTIFKVLSINLESINPAWYQQLAGNPTKAQRAPQPGQKTRNLSCH